MHGLINRALQKFSCDTYGRGFWDGVARDAGLGHSDFEAMLTYDPAMTDAVLSVLARRLGRDRSAVLEDVGTYLVSHGDGGLRRLLRFAGAGFEDFLDSLDDLPERARLAVPDLDLPRIESEPGGGGRVRIRCLGPHEGFGHVLVGVLRAMADDYGALVTIDHTGQGPGVETIEVALVVAGYAAGRRFDLGARTG